MHQPLLTVLLTILWIRILLMGILLLLLTLLTSMWNADVDPTAAATANHAAASLSASVAVPSILC
jgi:hypothetical protein